jgi:putative membrane protein insertion efficiency factor
MERQAGAEMIGWALRGTVRAYQLLVSPLLPPSCRFLPSCSEYAAEAIEQHGALQGMNLALRRLARCHPWGGSGYDPVPEPRLLAACPHPPSGEPALADPSD